MSAIAPPPDLLPRKDRSPDLQVVVHDTSRFEWRTTLPLPRAGSVPYEVEAEFQIPSNALSGRSPWDLLQGFSRLDGDITATGSDGSLRALRQKVVALARMLDRARQGFARHCDAAVGRGCSEQKDDAHEYLTTWLEAALGAVLASRQQLALVTPGDTAQLCKERCLADEFISVRLLDFLADSQQFVQSIKDCESLTDVEVKASLQGADEQLRTSLETELAYRREHGFALADPDIPDTLAKYVERSGLLKKHFQEVLALDREAYPLDDRVQQWIATFSALLAGMFVFGAQFLFGRWSMGSQLSSGLAVIVLLSGIAYAARDRLKEIGRAWISGKVYRFHAQRVVFCRLSSQAKSQKDLIFKAQEWCNESTVARPDPLNPESGASMRVTVVHHLHRGQLFANPTVEKSGAERIRHIFRYDLSPLFSRLQDPTKRVPVVDASTRRAIFVDAPRRYQLPVQIALRMEGNKKEFQGNLVVDKQGITRLEESPSPLAGDGRGGGAVAT